MQKHVGDNTAQMIDVVYQLSNTKGKELCERVWDGRFRDVERLLKMGVNVNYKDRRGVENGWTPLHTAAGRGHADMIKLLLVYDADIALKNNEGQTPVETALSAGNQHIVDILEDDTIVYRLKQRYELIIQQHDEGLLDDETTQAQKGQLFGSKAGPVVGGFKEYMELSKKGKAPTFDPDDFNELLDKESHTSKDAKERKKYIASLG